MKLHIEKWGRYFALFDQKGDEEELICIAVYKVGAEEVKKRLEELEHEIGKLKQKSV